jgi:hypothetical protein
VLDQLRICHLREFSANFLDCFHAETDAYESSRDERKRGEQDSTARRMIAIVRSSPQSRRTFCFEIPRGRGRCVGREARDAAQTCRRSRSCKESQRMTLKPTGICDDLAGEVPLSHFQNELAYTEMSHLREVLTPPVGKNRFATRLCTSKVVREYR